MYCTRSRTIARVFRPSTCDKRVGGHAGSVGRRRPGVGNTCKSRWQHRCMHGAHLCLHAVAAQAASQVHEGLRRLRHAPPTATAAARHHAYHVGQVDALRDALQGGLTVAVTEDDPAVERWGRWRGGGGF